MDSDFEEELLALTEGSNKRKRSKEKSSRSKRPKHEESEDTESEEDDYKDPYPLEGQYIDEEDRERLLDMTEVERERILADRMEKKQELEDRREINRLASSRSAPEGVAKAAKRQHTQRGATKEKRDKLDELKAKRKAKSEKKLNKAASKATSDSGEDMETSSDEEQEEEEEEGQYRPSNRESTWREDDADVNLEELKRCVITRNQLEKNYHTPWFEEWVRGCFVRFLIGSNSASENQYRICQVNAVVLPSKEGGYPLGGTTVHHLLELKHGSAIKSFRMTEVSNSPPSVREFERWKAQCKADKEVLPKRSDLVRKQAEMADIKSRTITEEDIAAMMHKKPHKQANANILERTRLLQERNLAERRNDYKEVQEIDEKLLALGYGVQGSPKKSDKKATEDLLAKVNERNRKANLEAVRRAEIQEAERRRQRKLAAGTATPDRLKSGLGTPADSRPATPLGGGVLTAPGGEIPVNGKTKAFESSVLESLDVDLGDF